MDLRRYSVYHAKTDVPVMIYGTAQECADAMGISRQTFYKHVQRMHGGKITSSKWAVYEDDF